MGNEVAEQLERVRILTKGKTKDKKYFLKIVEISKSRENTYIRQCKMCIDLPKDYCWDKTDLFMLLDKKKCVLMQCCC